MDNSIKKTITAERKLVYLVKSITKSKDSHNNNKLFEIAQNMYNDSKNETFTFAMKNTYEKKAINILKELSKKKYSDAQYYLGIIYQEKDKYKKAAKYFELSYQNRHPMGTFELAQCYQFGYGRSKDLQYAEILCRKAVTVGYCYPAMLHLGISYLYGTFGRKNTKEAVHWLKKTTETISESVDRDLIAKACYELYKIYAKGTPDNSILQDFDEAYKFLIMSAENGSVEAMVEITNIEKKDHEKVLYWAKKAAELDCLDAQIKLANWYFCDHSDIVDHQDKAVGFYWLKQAALPKNLQTDEEIRNQGCIQFILGTYYEIGIENVQLPDENEALYWFGLSAKLGINEAIEKVKEKQIQHNYSDSSISDFISYVMDKGLYGKPSESSLECQQILKDLPNRSHHSLQM